MKKIFTLLLFITIFNYQSHSQVEIIQAAADGVELLADVVSNVGCYDGCYDIFFLFFLDDVVIWTVRGMANHHRYLIENNDEFPSLSVDYMSHFAYDIDNQVNILQRVRGTAGIFSADFRLNQLSEFTNMTANSYRTINATFEFNTQPAKMMNFRFGSGILYDDYVEKVYNEYYASLGLSFFERRLNVTAEGRYAPCYSSHTSVYKEANLRADIRLFKMNRLSTSFMVGGFYQEYYQTVSILCAQAGLSFCIY